MKKPNISIVIPIYNVSEYIEDCLQSVAAQTYEGSLECLLIDDCGQDDSMDKAKRLIDNYKGAIVWRTVRHLQNGGQSAARNTGMKEMTGEYVYFLDSDDMIAPNCIEALAKTLEEDDYDMIAGNYSVVPEGSFPIVARPQSDVLCGDEIMDSYNKQHLYVMPWNKLYSISFLRKNKLQFLEKLYLEDCLWSFQVYSIANRIRFVDEPTYIYRVREGSTMTAMDVKRKLGFMVRIAQEMVEYENIHGIAQKSNVNNCFQGWIENYYKYVRENLDEPQQKTAYLELRGRVPFKWRNACVADGGKMKWQIRDLHWMLSPALGYCLYGNLMKIIHRK